MNIWTIINAAAWVLSAVIALILTIDFVKIEKSRTKKGRENDGEQ